MIKSQKSGVACQKGSTDQPGSSSGGPLFSLDSHNIHMLIVGIPLNLHNVPQLLVPVLYK